MNISMNITAALLGLSLVVIPARADKKPLYKDASKTPEERVADLLPRMTLEEKVAQLKGIWNTRMIQGILRGKYGYTGLTARVCTERHGDASSVHTLIPNLAMVRIVAQ